MTQRQLSEILGVSYQQAQKYENGINRVTAGQLYVITRELNTPIEYFFEGHSKETARPTHQRLLLEVVRHYGEIDDKRHREALSQLTRTLAGR